MSAIKKILAGGIIMLAFLGGSFSIGKISSSDDPAGESYKAGSAAIAKEKLGEQVLIKGGEYYVGSTRENDNRPLRKLRFKEFYIDIHPVTYGQYLEFMFESSYIPKGKFHKEIAESNPLLPVVNLTYEDAEAYASFNKKRLPTEWEWEIAARSLKKDNIYVSGKLASKLRGHFLYDKEYFNFPVFSYPPNELGIYGMAGNVFEWTSSRYPEELLHGEYFKNFNVMVIRGGAWTNRAFDVRTTTRTPFPARRCLGWVGFRCVSDSK